MVNPNLKRIFIRRSLVAGALAMAILAGLNGCCCLPHHPVASAEVLRDIAAQGRPSRLKAAVAEPARTAVQYEVGGRIYHADLYRSRTQTEAGILLVPGAAESGKDDPRLVAFAQTLAREQFAVLVPDLADFRQFNLGPRNTREVADGLTYLASRPDLAPQGHVGAAATSYYAVGPIILAALAPDLRDKIQFVVGVGGYYDLEKAVAFFTTGYFRNYAKKESPWQYQEPNTYGKWVFVRSNAGRLSSPTDRAMLQEIARRKLEHSDAPVELLAARLGPQGRAYYELITNKDPNRTPELLANLPAELKAEFDAINLARHDLSRLKARLILFHGYDDGIVPYTEIIALANAVPKGQARLFLIHGLAHVNLEKIGLRDRWRLWCGLDALLNERARKPSGKLPHQARQTASPAVHITSRKLLFIPFVVHHKGDPCIEPVLNNLVLFHHRLHVVDPHATSDAGGGSPRPRSQGRVSG
jgi:pimeloyl-ACP methyl ester carboxylesterase